MSLETRQPDAFAITFVFLGLATIAVALRTAVRAILRQFHWGTYRSSVNFIVYQSTR